MNNNLSIGLHWLEYTVHNESPLTTIRELNYFCDNDFAAAGGSLYGYIDMLAGRNGIILLSDSRKEHHHIIIPGKWLTEIGEPALLLLATIVTKGYKVTRLDIACDNHDIKPDPRELRERCNDGELVTHFRRRNSLENHSDGSITNYFGSMKSDRYLRVYDKTKETKGKITATRWEIVLRNEYATQCAKHILCKGLNFTFKGTLLSMMDFRIPTTQNRESRRKRMAWFSDFIGDTEKALYTIYEPGITLERMEHWLQKQVSRTLSTVLRKKNGDMGFIYDLIELGNQKKPRL